MCPSSLPPYVTLALVHADGSRLLLARARWQGAVWFQAWANRHFRRTTPPGGWAGWDWVLEPE